MPEETGSRKVGDDEHDREEREQDDAVAEARRSPRVVIWRGMYSSLARMDARTGNPLKAVFAASSKMMPVAVVTKKKPTVKSSKIVRAS